MTTSARTVLITGGARRLGRAIALRLAREGWRVAVHCHTSVHDAIDTARQCTQASGAECAHFVADLQDEAAVRALVPAVLARFGTLDALVHNAALFEYDNPESFTYALLERHLRANTAAPIVLAQALHEHLRARNAAPGAGVLINLLDQKLWNPNPDYLSYTLSKAALQSASTLLAQALAPQVRTVGIAPGLTLPGPQMRDGEHFARLHALSPLHQSSTPDEVADAVVFALHNRALTGTTLLVDGGQHLQRFERDFSMMSAAPDCPQ